MKSAYSLSHMKHPGRQTALVDDLHLLLGLAQELWREDPGDVSMPVRADRTVVGERPLVTDCY
jgi:hypothetical protein